jgi:hypothetical protein
VPIAANRRGARPGRLLKDCICEEETK